uniref:RAP domain-containing protein n=1 Tax=Chloropicon laureae TaxID=464258 RepID=A0A7S2Z5L2_9CHLO
MDSCQIGYFETRKGARRNSDAAQIQQMQEEEALAAMAETSEEAEQEKEEKAVPELLSADFYLSGEEKKCVEVDGPSHFFLNTLGPTGKTLFRNRVHRANGWEVVCLPHFEWEQLQEEEDKQAYIKDLLGFT